MIDLEFDTVDQAQTMLASLRQLWGKVEGQVMTNATARIFNLVETK
jgi:hypothetical protein